MATFSYLFNEDLFTTYDVRGIAEKEIMLTDAFYLGIAFGNFLNNRKTLTKKLFGMLIGEKPKVVLGQDVRELSTPFAEELIKGLILCGINVVDVGYIPSPVVCYSVSHFDCEAGIAIAGSTIDENMITINFVLNNQSLTGEEIKSFCEKLEDGISLKIKSKGVVNEIEMLETYATEVLSVLKFNPMHRLKVGVDCLDGTAGAVLSKMFSKLPFKMLLKNEKCTGELDINHNPLCRENLNSLSSFIEENNLDIAFSLDSDGRQLLALTKEGKVLKGDELFYIVVREYLNRKSIKNKQIVIDLASSIEIEKRIIQMGGKPIYASTGQSDVRQKMLRFKAELGMEAKGHLYIKDGFYGYDDGIFAMLKIISILSFEEISISDVLNEMPFTFETAEIRIKTTYEDEKYKSIKNMLIERLKPERIIEEGGIKFVFSNEATSFMMRVCNTEDAISFKAEARNVEDFILLEKLLEEIQKQYFKGLN